jgi:hypothetical protein
MAFKVKTDSKVSDALVPVDDNEFIKGFYEIKNLPDVSGGTQFENEKVEQFMQKNNIENRDKAVEILTQLKNEGKI